MIERKYWAEGHCVELSAQYFRSIIQPNYHLVVARRLAQANIITNKNLIPADKPEDWDHPSGLRIGTTEVTRLGMHEAEMESIADFIARILVEQAAPEDVVNDVVAFREPYQTLYYCFDHGMPGKTS